MAERALPDSLAGAAVALDAQTGAVLAMANKPTFDPNIFVSFQAQKERQKVHCKAKQLFLTELLEVAILPALR